MNKVIKSITERHIDRIRNIADSNNIESLNLQKIVDSHISELRLFWWKNRGRNVAILCMEESNRLERLFKLAKQGRYPREYGR